MWDASENLFQIYCFTNYETFRQRARSAEAIYTELTDNTQKWYTLYISTAISQTIEIFGQGTVERMKTEQTNGA